MPEFHGACGCLRFFFSAVKDHRGGVQDSIDPAGRNRSPGYHVQDHVKTHEGPDNPGGIGGEDNHFREYFQPFRRACRDNQESADAVNADIEFVVYEFGYRLHQPHGPPCLQGIFRIFLIGPGKFVLFILFGVVSTDNPHAGHVFPGHLVDIVRVVLHPAEARMGVDDQEYQHGDQQRQGSGRECRPLPVSG